MQRGSLNNGAWKEMETLWKNALRSGKKVEVDIKPIYDNPTKRPTRFEVDYTVDSQPFKETFSN
ncbi:MAG: DNA/RNA non-specific endonuclease [Cyclobacteriaceae bacterium]